MDPKTLNLGYFILLIMSLYFYCILYEAPVSSLVPSSKSFSSEPESRPHLLHASQDGDPVEIRASAVMSDHRAWPTVPRIEIIVITWNDIKILPYAIRFYRERLGPVGLRISVYDNESDDGTPELARALGCHVHSFSTGGKFDDLVHMKIKNNNWKDSEADWILVIDLDEWLDIRPSDLNLYELHNVTIVKPTVYTLVSANDTFDLTHLAEAAEGEGFFVNEMYEKPCLFNHRAVYELNALPGGHRADPQGQVKYLHDVEPELPLPKLFHAKFFNAQYLWDRFNVYAKRLPNSSIENGLSRQFLFPGSLPRKFAKMRETKQPIPGVNGSVFVKGESWAPIRDRLLG